MRSKPEAVKNNARFFQFATVRGEWDQEVPVSRRWSQPHVSVDGYYLAL